MTEAEAWAHLQEIPPGGGVAGPLRIQDDGSWSSDEDVDAGGTAVLDVFAPLQVRDRFVIGQLGQSLDGRIATESGHSHYINGEEDLRRLHRLRALVDAVVVGAGTVASDDPRLTVRRVSGSNPVRVVLDPRGRLSHDRRIFQDGAAPTLVLQAPGPDGGDTGVDPGVTVLRCPTGPEGRFDPHDVIAVLADRGLHRILVEGGGLTVSGFLSAGALHRLHVSVAPLLIGSGRRGITLPPIETLEEAIRPGARHVTLGSDVLFDLELDRGEA